MRHNQNRRSRGRSRKGPNPLTRSYESNGPDVKVRGTAAHVAEKYMTLARDAQSSGDTVAAENYLQHAEHYNRIVMAAQQVQFQPQFRDGQEDGYEDDRFNGRRDRFDSNIDLNSDDGDGYEGDGDDDRNRPPMQGRQENYDNRQQNNEQRPQGERQQNDRQNNDRQNNDRPQQNDRQMQGDRQQNDRQQNDRQQNDRQQHNDRPRGPRPDRFAGGQRPEYRDNGDRQDRGDRDNRGQDNRGPDSRSQDNRAQEGNRAPQDNNRQDTRGPDRNEQRFRRGEEPQPEIVEPEIEAAPVPEMDDAPVAPRRRRGRPPRSEAADAAPDETPDGAAALAAFPD